MVKIAIAGGSSQLAREIIDTLVATQKHEITALVRSDPSKFPSLPGVNWVQTTYQDKSELVQLLKGTHTVLCFITAHLDPNSETQKRLIDASVEAGVKRYAPSEWATGAKLEAAIDMMSWYAGKIVVREYLKKINQDKKVIEYCLFQPGTFLNYLGSPHKTANYVESLPMQINYDKLEAVVVEGHLDSKVTFTAVGDICNVVASAIEYEGEWPVVGGIRGDTLTISELLKLGEVVRGKPLAVDYVKEEDLRAGIIKADKFPLLTHPSIPPDQVEAFTKMGIIGILIGILEGAYDVSDEWNQLLPDYKFVQAEGFVTKLWDGK